MKKKKKKQKKKKKNRSMSYDNVISTSLWKSLPKDQASLIKKSLSSSSKLSKRKSKKKLKLKKKKLLYQQTLEADQQHLPSTTIQESNQSSSTNVGEELTLTVAEKAQLERQRVKLREVALKLVAVTPEQQIANLNKKLESLPLHFDMPKL